MANESRLIDANELVSKINKLEVFYFTGETDVQIHDCQMVELGAVLSEIDDATTVDAVEVVQCGKCLYYSETTGKDSGKPCGYGVCTKPFHVTNIVANEDFCSFGQRRSDAKMDGDGNG